MLLNELQKEHRQLAALQKVVGTLMAAAVK